MSYRLRSRVPLLAIVACLISEVLGQTPAPANTTAVSTTPPPASDTYACKNCIYRPVRAMYLYSGDTTENMAAPGNGSMCDDPATATRECFEWKNWNSGWVGALLANVFAELNPPEIIAMTRANFSEEVYDVYTGGSSYTRCVYEIRLDNVDVCVGDFWETEQRRKLVPFSSQMLGDSMNIVSVPRGFKASSTSSEGQQVDWSILYRNVLQPFSNEAWYILLGMIVYGGILMWVCEYDVEDSP